MTGGSGVVGRAVVRQLVAEGHRVKALARSRAAVETLQVLGAEPVVGDVVDPESLDAGLEGREAAYHVAGVNQFCALRRTAAWLVAQGLVPPLPEAP